MTEAEAALSAARAAADAGAMQQAKAAVTEAERRLAALAAKDHALKNLRDRAHEAARLGAGRAAAEEARAEAKKARGAEKARAKRLEKRIADEAAALVDDERRLALMRAGLSLAEHRAGLVEGEPCPLCGATEHPGVEVAESEAAVGAEAERVEARRSALTHDRTELALAIERARAAEATAAQAEAVIEEATAALARVAADWEMARMAYGADVPAAPLGAAGAIGAAIELNHAAREATEAALVAAREAVAAIEARREAIEGHLAAVDAAHRVRRDAWAALQSAQAEVERAGERASRLAEQAAELQAELDGGFSGWPEWSAQVDPEVFAELAAGRVEDHAHRSRRLVAARGAIVEAERALGVIAAEVEQRREAVAAARAAVDAARLARDAIAAQRATVFEGRPVEAVEAGFARAVRSAEAEASAARDARAAVEARRETTADLLAEAEKARDRARRAAESARALLVEALEGLEIDERALRERLSEGPEWVSRTRDRLAEIDRRLGVAQALHGERRRAREVHERAGRPAIDPTALAAARGEADAALRAFREALEEDRGVLRQDDRARERRAGLAPGLAEEEAKLRVLADLSELIGSHDGGRFRDFAQSLTLDAVVGLANSHLRELAPRYALMRVPSEDLELQVIDRDMGDEIRSVQSLSGGESFLVSLALALGLASLSARDTRLESLFIDEGFGSLDDKTLDQALSTLDMLQASGRQVGLISHVPNFSDRIGIQVAVVPEGPGRSRVEVRGWRVGDRRWDAAAMGCGGDGMRRRWDAAAMGCGGDGMRRRWDAAAMGAAAMGAAAMGAAAMGCGGDVRRRWDAAAMGRGGDGMRWRWGGDGMRRWDAAMDAAAMDAAAMGRGGDGTRRWDAAAMGRGGDGGGDGRGGDGMRQRWDGDGMQRRWGAAAMGRGGDGMRL
ncbi:MAG: SbcC/MukB-like Walker B domain-containing protein [bacterium]